MTFNKAINKDDFMEFIRNLKHEQGDTKFALFLDNLRVHHTVLVRDLCKELDIPLIFNLPYSPDLNPIETYFSLIKNHYKRIKLNNIANDKKIKVIDMVSESTDLVKDEYVQNICKCGIAKLLYEDEEV